MATESTGGSGREDDAVTRGGLRGRMDRLYKIRLDEAAALKRAIEIIDADDRQTARELAPKKFREALNHRASANGDEPPVMKDIKRVKAGRARKKPAAERLDDIRRFLTRYPESTSAEVGKAIGLTGNNNTRTVILLHRVAKPLPRTTRSTHEPFRWVLKTRAKKTMKMTKTKTKVAASKKNDHRRHHPNKISGKSLTLFLLEHLNEEQPRSVNEIMEALAEAGSPIKSSQQLNGPLGAVLQGHGLVKKRDDGTFHRTSKGSVYAETLRAALESKGKVAAGGYTAERRWVRRRAQV